MRFSVVVCTYDIKRIEDLDECIHSLLRQEYDRYEVIVVVDHNKELFSSLLRRYAKVAKLKVVLNFSERGLAGSMNCGISHARGQIVCFIDDDAIADDNWLPRLESVYGDTDEVYAVGGCTKPLWMTGRKPDYLPDEFHWMVGAMSGYLPDEVEEVRNLWSGNISYRKEVFDKVGFFLPRLGRKGDASLQGEDAEFGIRLLKATGNGVKYAPNAIVYHKIYAERVKLRALLNRAYGQGRSKAYIRKIHNDIDALSVEKGYLKHIFRSSIEKLKYLVTGPDSIASLKQISFMIIATMTTLLGFIEGSIRARP